jgi:hypothetical protein
MRSYAKCGIDIICIIIHNLNTFLKEEYNGLEIQKTGKNTSWFLSKFK